MARKTSHYVCSNCGHAEAKWLGQCPECGEWNTLSERALRGAGGSARTGSVHTRTGSPGFGSSESRQQGSGRAVPLSEVGNHLRARLTTGIGELDRALGGGLVRGATVLIGGEPGIGKSTLLLQMAGQMASQRVLYVSAEESAAQIRGRAERLRIGTPAAQQAGPGLFLLCTAHLTEVLDEVDRIQPSVVVVDSLQTMLAEEAGSVPGTVNQIKLITHSLAVWAREQDGCVVAVAHVTKEGQIAGPKVVEHMVDAVLLFEHSGSDLRFLRASKNRFGAIEEVGIFTMEGIGLVEVRDPARAFLGDRTGSRPAGVIAAPSWEGSRVLVVELQALTVAAKGSVSRTFSDRIDSRRVTRVAAVLEKHVGVRFADQDIYVNVAGGMRVADVALDLPLALALYSARSGLAVDATTLATGELSLAGEVRPVSHSERRERAAAELGFARMVGPLRDIDGRASGHSDPGSVTWRGLATIREAIAAVFADPAGG